MTEETRRKFLLTTATSLAAVTVAAAVYPIFRYLSPRQGGSVVTKVTIPEKEIPADGAKFFEFEGRPAAIVRKGGSFSVVSAVCTHLGCVIQWQKDSGYFLCPCHAGQFTADGTVISGPPPKPLPKIPFKVGDGSITIG